MIRLLVVFCFISCVSTAQENSSLTLAENLGLERRESFVEAFRVSDNTFNVLKVFGWDSKKEQYFMTQWDNKLIVTKSAPIDLMEGGNKNYLEGMLTLGENHFLISSFFDKKTTKVNCFVERYNMNSLTQLGNKRKLFEQRNTTEKKYCMLEWDVKLQTSHDNKHGLIIADPHSKSKRMFTIINDAGEVVWQKTISFKYNEKQYTPIKYDVLSNGDLVVLAKFNTNGENSIRVLKYSKGGEDVNGTKLELPQGIITDINMTVVNQDLIFSGVYTSDLSTYDEGLFCIKMNGSDLKQLANEKIILGIEHFADTLNGFQNFRNKQLVKKGKENKVVNILRYKLHSVDAKQNGGLVLRFEESVDYKMEERIKSQTGVTEFKYHFIFKRNNVLVTELSNTNEFTVKHLVSKKQEYEMESSSSWLNRDFQNPLSFSIIKLNNKEVMLFNDYANNLSVDINSPTYKEWPIKSGKNDVIHVIDLTGDNLVKMEAVELDKKMSANIQYHHTIKLDEQTILLFAGYRSSTNTVGVLKF
jgi:hypothetical protein